MLGTARVCTCIKPALTLRDHAMCRQDLLSGISLRIGINLEGVAVSYRQLGRNRVSPNTQPLPVEGAPGASLQRKYRA
jgi:hypothetical protein